MAIALVAHTQIAGAANGGTSSEIDTTPASLLVVVITQYGTNTQVIPTDSLGNTWIALTRQTDAGNSSNCIFYVANPTVGSGHTFTVAGTGDFLVSQVLAFSGVTTISPLDVQNGTSAGSGTAVQPGSVTPSHPNSLVITGFSGNTTSATPSAIDSGFTITDQSVQSGGVSFAGGAAYLIQTAAAPVNPTWTNTSAAVQLSSTIAVFKPAAASGVLSGASPATSAATGVLSARGSLVGTSPAVSTAVGTMVAGGILVGESPATSGTSGVLAGIGTISASAAAISAASAMLHGSGILDAASAGMSSAIGDLSGQGALRSGAAATSAATGTLSGGPSGLSGGALATSTASGFMVAFGALVGGAAAISVATGIISGAAPFPPFTPAPQRTGTIPSHSRFGAIPRTSRFGVIR